VLPDRRQPRLGTKQVGYIDYMFAEDRVDIRIVEPPELTNHDIDEFPDTDGHRPAPRSVEVRRRRLRIPHSCSPGIATASLARRYGEPSTAALVRACAHGNAAMILRARSRMKPPIAEGDNPGRVRQDR
jgi:hypothetical protein